jgi:hypothetical protein
LCVFARSIYRAAETALPPFQRGGSINGAEALELKNFKMSLTAAPRERRPPQTKGERLLAQTTDALSRAEEAVRAKTSFWLCWAMNRAQSIGADLQRTTPRLST